MWSSFLCGPYKQNCRILVYILGSPLLGIDQKRYVKNDVSSVMAT